MIDGALTAVVVPAFNEARWIEEVLGTMPPGVDRVVVVDDASSDGTAERARSARCLAPVTVLRQDTNRGVGAAIARGYRHAARDGAEVIAVMAGDGQMDPRDLPAVVGPIARGEADYVKGNRFAHPEVWRAMPPARMAGSWVLALLTSWAAGVRVHDSQCGYTAISARALERLDLAALWPRYGYPNDLIGQLALAELRIVEVPVRPVYRGEHSGLTVWHAALICGLVARVGVRRAARPLRSRGRTR